MRAERAEWRIVGRNGEMGWSPDLAWIRLGGGGWFRLDKAGPKAMPWEHLWEREEKRCLWIVRWPVQAPPEPG